MHQSCKVTSGSKFLPKSAILVSSFVDPRDLRLSGRGTSADHSCTLFRFCLFHSLGSYDVTEAEGVQRGTKIVVHLRGDAYDFAKEEKIKGNELFLPAKTISANYILVSTPAT